MRLVGYGHLSYGLSFICIIHSCRELRSEKKHLEEKSNLLQRLSESSQLSSRVVLVDASVQTDATSPLERSCRENQTEQLLESSVQKWAHTSASALSTRAPSLHSAHSQTRLLTSSAAASLIEWSREAPDSEDGARSTLTALSPASVSVTRTLAATHSEPVSSSSSTPSPTLSEPRAPLMAAASTPSQPAPKKSGARNETLPVAHIASRTPPPVKQLLIDDPPAANNSSSSIGVFLIWKCYIH